MMLEVHATVQPGDQKWASMPELIDCLPAEYEKEPVYSTFLLRHRLIQNRTSPVENYSNNSRPLNSSVNNYDTFDMACNIDI